MLVTRQGWHCSIGREGGSRAGFVCKGVGGGDGINGCGVVIVVMGDKNVHVD